MKQFKWSAEKNELLKRERGVSFEQIIVAVGSGDLLEVYAHANSAKYPRQRVMAVNCDGYVCLVPFIEEDEYLFLKTIIPSRKATRDHLKRSKKP